MAQYDVDLRDYWRIFRKRKAVVFLMVFLAGVFSYGFAKLKEPVPLYEATAAVKIDRHTNITDFLSGGFWTQAETLTTQAFIITSFPVLIKAAQELGLLSKDLTPDEVQNSIAAMAVVERLKGMTTADPSRAPTLSIFWWSATTPTSRKKQPTRLREPSERLTSSKKTNRSLKPRILLRASYRFRPVS